ncbi:J domain-containing protein [Rhizobium sp. CG5]|uniref:J domain-containing protein n=1 Tax=Rhizobium sp. CG5 TaxID=2726076 RepID=UPI00203485B1|nr:J domain-containing protein [Rhizobium sp. CG5]
MIDPYEILGVAQDADDEQIRAAYRLLAKATHPDSGGDTETFIRGQKACELLLDPARRKFFDETGYDLELTEAMDLQGLLVIEKLVNEIVLDDREPGTFDPIAGMRAKLTDEISKTRFQIREMQGHSSRLQNHLGRLGDRPGKDVLGYMLRARMETIGKLVAEAAARIEATERAFDMLDAYSYTIDLADEEEAAPDSLRADEPPVKASGRA